MQRPLTIVSMLLLLGACIGQGPRGRDAVRGIVLVSIDTLRRDHVGVYGHGRGATPRLDAWARNGVVFQDAVSVSSWTLPAHLTMLTSVEPARHGGVDGHHGFNGAVPSVAEDLKRAGFATHAITSHVYVSPAYGLHAGFDRFDYAPRRADVVAEKAIAALDAFGSAPFFLFVHFYDPHWPYAAPRPYGPLSPEEAARPAAGVPPGQAPPRDPAPLREGYLGEVRFVDAQLGRVFDHLERARLHGQTLVIVTSDHGEEFGEHGGYEHRRTLYEEIVRIPLILSAPGVDHRVEPAQVSLLDLAPTVLEAAGRPKAPSHRGRSLLGRLPARAAYGETDVGVFERGRRARRLFLRDGEGRGKLIVTLDRRTDEVLSEEWFDLARDPVESTGHRPPAGADTWRKRLLLRWREARGLAGPAVGATLTPEEQSALGALGYVGE